MLIPNVTEFTYALQQSKEVLVTTLSSASSFVAVYTAAGLIDFYQLLWQQLPLFTGLCVLTLFSYVCLKD